MLKKGSTVFGNWTVEETIGSGAFGTVYKIKKEDFGEEYFAAMKVIRIPQDKDDKSRLYSEGMSDEDISLYYKQIAGDFIKEIKMLSALDGVTNIVDYKDHVIEPNEDLGYTIYIKMQLLTPISKLLVGEGNKAKFLSNEDIIRLGKDMCSALEVCEKKRIIHRDIKIDNIFVSDEGDYKLGDFGIARQLEATQGEMSKKGTLLYMAPEVFKGEKYDRTADIYSLGIVLYRLLNKNRAPFFPDYPQPIKFTDKEQANNRRLNGEVVPFINGLSDGLNAILRKACAYNPRDRYQTAGEFKAALEGMDDTLIAPVVIPPVAAVNSDNTEDDGTTVGLFSTMATVPAVNIGKSDDATERAGNVPDDATEGACKNPFLVDSEFTATQGIFAEAVVSDTIFNKETVTIAEPNEKTESVFSAANTNKKEENNEPEEDEKKKKGAVSIIIALILLIALGVGIFFFINRGSGKDKDDGSKKNSTESTLSENTIANDISQNTTIIEQTSGMNQIPTFITTEILSDNVTILETNTDFDIPTTLPEGINVEDQPHSNANTPYLNSNGYYELCTADDLFWFAKEVNSGNNDINAVLKNSINLNNQDWNPIGTDDEPYYGDFDGRGYTVSGLYCNMPYTSSLGFFGVSYGNIINLVVKGYFQGWRETGGVVAFNCGKVENCQNYCEIECESRAGGIVGLNNGIVISCSNFGYVSGYENIGGIVGLNWQMVESCCNKGEISCFNLSCGGIVGNNYASSYHATIKSCSNEGSINGQGLTGGIAGKNYGSIENCNNSGNVDGYATVGGIVGYNCSDNYTASVNTCSNSGSISGERDVDGIVGRLFSGDVELCNNTGSVNYIN